MAGKKTMALGQIAFDANKKLDAARKIRDGKTYAISLAWKDGLGQLNSEKARLVKERDDEYKNAVASVKREAAAAKAGL